MAMFTDSTDENGVTISSNAHPSKEFDNRLKAPRPTHYMRAEDGSLYADYAPDSLEHRVKDDVFGQIGNRVGTMTFKSEIVRSKR
jgi:hypothetical protein